MSLWGLIALVALILMVIEGIFRGGIRRTDNRRAQACYSAGYLTVMSVVVLGILIDLGRIGKDSQLIWLIPVLAVFASAMGICGIWLDSKKSPGQ